MLALVAILGALALGGLSACQSKPAEEDSVSRRLREAQEAVALERSQRQDAARGEAARPFAEFCYGPPQCVPGMTQESTRTIGGKTYRDECWRVAGPEDEDHDLNLGVLSDVKAATEANLAALDEYVAFFRQNNAEAILLTGDSGEDNWEDIARVWRRLLASNLPVLVIMGNRESNMAYARAWFELRGEFPNLFNMHIVRLFQFDDGAVISLPGYHDENFIHHKPGCVYGEDQLGQIEDVFLKRVTPNSPVVLMMHGPMKGTGREALDYAVPNENAAVNTGDQMLNGFLTATRIPFAVFGNIHEAGGAAVSRDRNFGARVAPNTASTSLYLNVGPANTDRWTMNDGTISYGMAAVLRIHEGQGTYVPFRRPAPAE